MAFLNSIHIIFVVIALSVIILLFPARIVQGADASKAPKSAPIQNSVISQEQWQAIRNSERLDKHKDTIPQDLATALGLTTGTEVVNAQTAFAKGEGGRHFTHQLSQIENRSEILLANGQGPTETHVLLVNPGMLLIKAVKYYPDSKTPARSMDSEEAQRELNGTLAFWFNYTATLRQEAHVQPINLQPADMCQKPKGTIMSPFLRDLKGINLFVRISPASYIRERPLPGPLQGATLEALFSDRITNTLFQAVQHDEHCNAPPLVLATYQTYSNVTAVPNTLTVTVFLDIIDNIDPRLAILRTNMYRPEAQLHFYDYMLLGDLLAVIPLTLSDEQIASRVKDFVDLSIQPPAFRQEEGR